MSDTHYFKDETDADGLPTWKVMPLIVFPADKQRVEAGGQDYNLAGTISMPSANRRPKFSSKQRRSE